MAVRACFICHVYAHVASILNTDYKMTLRQELSSMGDTTQQVSMSLLTGKILQLIVELS